MTGTCCSVHKSTFGSPSPLSHILAEPKVPGGCQGRSTHRQRRAVQLRNQQSTIGLHTRLECHLQEALVEAQEAGFMGPQRKGLGNVTACCKVHLAQAIKTMSVLVTYRKRSRT
ncbi:hypothetical protein KIL84_003004 [Mauremys mutica]|uniref:Uncharacterized protein n=1 Tax=Mauremys mutica TaxID=74926 RepID=A0A9D4AT16_9SAUR|nr:hypothetical protein KIL84_003004 [Mauremys mutica]